MNRRDLLLTVPLFIPTFAQATIPPPPSSPWYLLFIADGIYKISNLYVVTLPASAGTCRSYSASVVSQAFGSKFTYTQRTGIGIWHLMLNAPSFRWWEYYDQRNGRYFRLYQGDRLEAKFSDGSRVKVVFNGQTAPVRFVPLVGTERLPDGTRLYPLDRDRDGGLYKGRGSRDGGGVTSVTPSVTMFSWHWSSQETPW